MSSKSFYTVSDILEQEQQLDMDLMLQLIKDSKYFSDIYDTFELGKYKEDIISIPGAYSIVTKMLDKESEVIKFDLNFTFTDISITEYYDSHDIDIDFNFNEQTIPEKLNLSDKFTAKSHYDSKTYLFKNHFGIDKYSDFCIDHKLIDLIDYNIKKLLGKLDNESLNYRFIEYKENIYLRAITSENRYKDYNNKIATFVAIFAIHKLAIENDIEFIIKHYECTDSKLNIYFYRKEQVVKNDHLLVRSIVRVSNSELGDGSIRFDFNFEIYDENNPEKTNIYLNPNLLLQSITHNSTVANFRSKINITKKLKEKESHALSIIENINSIEDPKKFKTRFLSKITERSTLFSYKEDFEKIRDEINLTTDLLEFFNKVELLVGDEDKDYLREKLYNLFANSNYA